MKRLNRANMFHELNRYCEKRFSLLDKDFRKELDRRKGVIAAHDARLLKSYKALFSRDTPEENRGVSLGRGVWRRLGLSSGLEAKERDDADRPENPVLVRAYLKPGARRLDAFCRKLNLSDANNGFLGDKLTDMKKIGEEKIDKYRINTSRFAADRETSGSRISNALEKNKKWANGRPTSLHLPNVSILATMWVNILYVIQYPFVKWMNDDDAYRDRFDRLKALVEWFLNPTPKKKKLGEDAKPDGEGR